jgi:hypothetical protein
MVDMYSIDTWIGLGLNKRRGWFIIFVRAQDVFYWNKHISSSKCQHKLAYNVSGLILVCPH